MVICVNTEKDKLELIQQSKYVHDYVYIRRNRKTGKERWYSLDSDKAGILMHIYTNPDLIKVIK